MGIKNYLIFIILLLGLFSIDRALAQRLPPLQPEQETCTALALCGGYFYTPYSYTGYGRVKEEFQSNPGNGGGCHGESNSVWFRIDVVTSGKMSFIIKPDNPRDDYDFTVWDGTKINCLFVYTYSYDRLRCNGNTGFGTDGTLGLSDTAQPTRIEGGANSQGMLKSLDVKAGNFYYILVDNFTGSTKGFSIDFAGSTAVFKSNGLLPKFVSTSQDSCKNSVRINVLTNTQIQCSSIAADGSDFELVPAVAKVIAASGANCVGSLGYSTQIGLGFSKSLPVGKYTLRAKKGGDNNTLLSLCGEEQLVGDSIEFIVDSTSVEPAPKYTGTVKDPTCNNSRKLGVLFSKDVQCSSIASDGSDFELVPAIAHVISAIGQNCLSGLGNSTRVNIIFNRNLPIGTYTLRAKKGSDNNVLFDRCGVEQLLTDSVVFTVDTDNTEPTPRFVSTVKNATCDYAQKLGIVVSKQITCNSIASDGSDFELVPAVATVVGAAGVNCDIDATNSTQINLAFSQHLPVGTYTLKARRGNDSNTLMDLCGEEQLVGDSIIFTTVANSPKYSGTEGDTCKTTRKLAVRISKRVSCSSIAIDGSDFEIVPAVAEIVSAVGQTCTIEGFTNKVFLTFSKDLPVGDYTLRAKKGNDNNFLIDSCGEEQLATDQIAFSVDYPGFSVNAGNDTIVCAGVSVQLKAVVKGWPATVSWAPADYLNNSTAINPIATPVESTSYIVSAIPNRINEACTQKDTVEIKVLNGFDLWNSDTIICRGGQVPINTVGNTEYHYSWSSVEGVSDVNDPDAIISPKKSGIYTLTGSYAGCKDTSKSIQIKVLQGFQLFNNDTTICRGGSVAMNVIGDKEFTYQWMPANYLSDASVINTMATPETNTVYTITASYAGCKDSSRSVKVKVLNGFELGNNDTVICSGSTIQLNAIGDEAYTYKWSPATFLSSSSLPNVFAKPDSTILYMVTASYPGCKDTSQTVTISVEPMPHILPLQPQKVCVGETIQLSATVSPALYSDYHFKWNPATSFDNASIENPIYKALGSTEVSLIVSTASGCADTVTQLFTASLPPTVDAGPDRVTNLGTKVLLQGFVENTATSMQWSPANYLSANNIPTPSANPPNTQQYVLSATSVDDCASSDTVLVTVLKDLYIPNAFSPNGDGINDVWNIPGLSAYENGKAQVYNRWGQLVFESIGYAQPWNGTFKGRPLPLGVYYYTINLQVGRQALTGALTIMR